MIKLFILDRNERLNIDKSKETFKDIAEKLNEEYVELNMVLTGECTYNREQIVSEALDVIQVVIGLLDKLKTGKMNLEKEVKIHNAKLKGRGWEVKRTLEIK